MKEDFEMKYNNEGELYPVRMKEICECGREEKEHHPNSGFSAAASKYGGFCKKFEPSQVEQPKKPKKGCGKEFERDSFRFKCGEDYSNVPRRNFGIELCSTCGKYPTEK